MLKALFFHIDTLLISAEQKECNTILKELKNTLRNVKKNNLYTVLISSLSKEEWERLLHTYNLEITFSKFYFDTPFTISSIQSISQFDWNSTDNAAIYDSNEIVVVADSSNAILTAKNLNLAHIGLLLSSVQTQDLSQAPVLIESFHSVAYRYFSDILKRSLGEPLTISSTKHLILREFSLSDIPALYEIYQNPKVKKHLDSMELELNTMIEIHQAYIQSIYDFYGYGLWGIFYKESNQLIGCCGIQNNTIDGTSEIELSYLLSPLYWKQGYAKEIIHAVFLYAKNHLDMDRIVAIIDTDNTASICLAKSIGMIFEKNIYYHNKIRTLYSISLEHALAKNKGAYVSKKIYENLKENASTFVYSRYYNKD